VKKTSLQNDSQFAQDFSLGLNPDSAVAIDGKRDARSFRNEVDGFVPLSRIDQRCCAGLLSYIAMT